MDTLAALRRKPSAQAWELAIRQLLLGKYDGYLAEIGGTEEFVRITLAESQDLALAEKTFRTALGRIISAWNPAVPAPELQFERHIQLIAAFFPAAGFHKLLDQLEEIGFFPTLPRRSPHVDRMALLAMGHYFPRHPFVDESNKRTFKAYEKFLRASLANPDFSGHACRRLLELTLLSPESQEVRDLVKKQPEKILPDLFRLIFLTRHSNRQKLLSAVFSTVLTVNRADLEDLFDELLKEIDAHMICEEEPTIRFRKDEEINIHLQEAVKPFYWGYRSRKGEASARGTIEELKRRFPKKIDLWSTTT